MLSRVPLLAFLVACGQPGGQSDAQPFDSRSTTDDSMTMSDGALVDGAAGADGAPTRRPCVEQFGSGLTTSYGRLDGFLVAIVPQGSNQCHGDADHIHLQILAGNATYDVAVNVGGGTQDVHTTTRDLAFPAWSEGWHPGGQEDYVALGVHAGDLPLQTSAQIASALTSDLATVNHITIFATGYASTGAHLVHRNGNGHDGMIVTQPLSSPAHARMFAFSGTTF